MKNILQISRKVLALFLVWMLTQLGPVQDLRIFSGGLISNAEAADARLPDCSNFASQNSDAGTKGDKCTIKDVGVDGGDRNWMISEGYVSTLLTWAVAMVFMYQVLRCRMPNVSCGYSTIFSAVGAIALFGGEIASVVAYATSIGKIKKKVEYRPDQVRNVQEKCASGGIGSGTGSGSIGDISACDQLDYLKAQQSALDSAKTGATWKFGLAIAAGAAFAIAAIIELVGWLGQNAHDAILAATGTATLAGLESAQAACAGPQAAACVTQCQACAVGVSSAQSELLQLLTLNNDVVTPTTSQIDCTKYRVTMSTAEDAAETACLAAAGPGAACLAAAQGYIRGIHAKLVELHCPRPSVCILACQVPTTLITQHSPSDYYDAKRSTCGGAPTDILQLTSGQLQQGYGELSLNHYLDITKLPDIFFHHTPSATSALLNEEEIQREMAQTRTEIELSKKQEAVSLSDYRKVRTFYGDEILADNQFDFLKIFLDSATAIDKDEKSEDSGMPVNQVIGSSMGLVAMAIPVFIGLLKTADLEADNAFATPARRTGWNTLAAALAFAQATYTKLAVIDILDKEIKSIQTILDSKALAAGKIATPTTTSIPYNEVSVSSTFFEPPPPLPGNQTYPCPAGGDGKGGCKDVSNTMDSALGSLDLSSLSGLTGSLKNLNNGMAGKKTMGQGTLTSTTTLANAARGLKKKISELQLKLNKSREQKKQSPIDFAGNQDKTLKGLYKKAKDYLAAKGMTAQSMMPNSPVAPVSEKDLEKKLADDLANSKKVAVIAPAVPAANGLGDLNFENVGAEDAGGGAALSGGTENTPSKELDGSFQVPNNDIGSDVNADIFQMLSSRYLKTAYPIFFDEEKTPAKKP